MSQGLVKSAARALDILEVFAERRERMSAAQLGATLGYPKSSLSVLLRSLVAQGYLSDGGGEGEYFPTMKLVRIGDWIPAALLGSENLLPMLGALRETTGETVTLTAPAGLQMRCLHALLGTHPIALQVEEGVTFPIVGTAVGAAWLATQSAETVAATFERWQRQPGHGRKDLSAIRAQVEQARADGHATAYDAVLPDTGAIAMPIGAGADVLVVGVAGLNVRIKRKEAAIVRAMKQAIGSARR